VATPSMAMVRSTTRLEFVTTSDAFVPTVRSVRICNAVPAATVLVSCSVLVDEPTPRIVRLLIVRLPAGVAELIVTVLLAALVIRTAALLLVGTPAVQLVAFVQNELTLFVQVLVVSAPRAIA